MTTIAASNAMENAPLAGGHVGAAVSPAELAELMGAFTVVTARLEQTHAALRDEVARLQFELEQANEALQRGKRLAALGEMAAGIAHEIRNPLGSIRLYAGLLDQDLADRPGQRVTAQKIVQAVRGLDAIVGDVLSFAREMRISPAPVRASELFIRACEASVIEGCRARVIINVDEGFDPVVNVDADLIHQALVNLIRNARQAMLDTPAPQSGHMLTLDARVQRDASDRPLVILTVRDTGPGLSPTVMDRMFNPFFTTRATGTGLGLAIVHRIVDAHAGRITARSVDPASGGGLRGALFEIELPAVQPMPVIPARAAASRSVAPTESNPKAHHTRAAISARRRQEASR